MVYVIYNLTDIRHWNPLIKAFEFWEIKQKTWIVLDDIKKKIFLFKLGEWVMEHVFILVFI
jgi:hypothetical protein